jgi:hypothetical protein
MWPPLLHLQPTGPQCSLTQPINAESLPASPGATSSPAFLPAARRMCQKSRDHAHEGAILRAHPRSGDHDRLGRRATEGFLPVDHHQGGQQGNGHRERDDADRARQVERRAATNGCTLTVPIAINPP